MTFRTATLACCLALSGLPASISQQPTPLPVYDVVSVRENRTGSTNMRWQYGADSFLGENVTLVSLLVHAYGLRPDQLSGAPPWASSTRFDVKAKVVDPDLERMKHLTRQQRIDMLLPVLKERFGLRAHFETKEMPTYDLVAAKGGIRMDALQPKQDDANSKGSFMFGRDRVEISSGALSILTNALAMQLERSVVDKTGLTGVYSLKLKWAPNPESADADGLPSLFTALQEQLGLRLQPSRGPVQVLVIDHIERPSGNDD